MDAWRFGPEARALLLSPDPFNRAVQTRKIREKRAR